MKFLFVLCPLILSTLADLTDEQKNKLIEYNEQCMEETGVDFSFVGKALSGQFEDDHKFKLHLFCLSKKIGLQDEEGKLQMDVLRQKITRIIGDPDKVDEILEKCAIQRAAPEETSFSTLKCYYDVRHGNSK